MQGTSIKTVGIEVIYVSIACMQTLKTSDANTNNFNFSFPYIPCDSNKEKQLKDQSIFRC